MSGFWIWQLIALQHLGKLFVVRLDLLLVLSLPRGPPSLSLNVPTLRAKANAAGLRFK